MRACSRPVRRVRHDGRRPQRSRPGRLRAMRPGFSTRCWTVFATSGPSKGRLLPCAVTFRRVRNRCKRTSFYKAEIAAPSSSPMKARVSNEYLATHRAYPPSSHHTLRCIPRAARRIQPVPVNAGSTSCAGKRWKTRDSIGSSRRTLPGSSASTVEAPRRMTQRRREYGSK